MGPLTIVLIVFVAAVILCAALGKLRWERAVTLILAAAVVQLLAA